MQRPTFAAVRSLALRLCEHIYNAVDIYKNDPGIFQLHEGRQVFEEQMFRDVQNCNFNMMGRQWFHPALSEVQRLFDELCEQRTSGCGFRRGLEALAEAAKVLQRQAETFNPTEAQDTANEGPVTPSLPLANWNTLPTEESLPDGPFNGDGFRFRNKEVRFGRAAKQLALVLALWSKKTRRPHKQQSILAVMEKVYGHDHDSGDSKFRQLCSDTQAKLDRVNTNLRIRCVQGYISLVILSL